MKCENAINFLLYSYFKITLESDKDAIIEAAVDKAYHDATNQAAFNTRIAKDDLKSKDEAYRAYQSVKKDILIPFAKEISCIDENWHKNLCRKICEKYKNMNIEIKCKNLDNAFTIGNAQKWVNMTLKNLYVIALVFEENGKNNDLTYSVISNAPNFHVPIDSYILQKLKENNINGVTGSGETYYYKNKAWSKLDGYDTYMELQNEIRKMAGKNPIAWEGPAWLEVAKNRKNRNKKPKVL